MFVDGASWKRFNNEKSDVYLVDKGCEILMFIAFSVMGYEFYGWLQNYIYLDEKWISDSGVQAKTRWLYHKQSRPWAQAKEAWASGSQIISI